MAKKICSVCNKEIGMLAGKAKIKDGYVCAKCYVPAGIGIFENSRSFNSDTVKEYISRRIPLVSSFNATKTVEKGLVIDDNNKIFKVGLDLFEFSDLLSFELLEDGKAITKGGLGSAVAGGLLFGGAGAVVGGITGGKKSKGVCTSMKIRITVKNSHTDTVYINLVFMEIKTDSLLYKAAQESAQKYLSALQIIADTSNQAEAIPASVDIAADIEKFHALMEKGVITEEEFAAKKAQLLDI